MKNVLILIVLCMLGNLGFAAADRELQPCQYLVKVNFYRENGKVELEASSLEVPVFPGDTVLQVKWGAYAVSHPHSIFEGEKPYRDLSQRERNKIMEARKVADPGSFRIYNVYREGDKMSPLSHETSLDFLRLIAEQTLSFDIYYGVPLKTIPPRPLDGGRYDLVIPKNPQVNVTTHGGDSLGFHPGDTILIHPAPKHYEAHRADMRPASDRLASVDAQMAALQAERERILAEIAAAANGVGEEE